MIDKQGYRSNVGFIVVNKKNELLWCRRVGQQDAWQFPQGGMLENESIQQAMYRELDEELGLTSEDVDCIAVSRGWLKYRLPKQFIRYYSRPLCIGQKQKWFLLRLVVNDDRICFDSSEKPEFSECRWVDYWYPVQHVIAFKRRVYKKALLEFESLVLKRAAHKESRQGSCAK